MNGDLPAEVGRERVESKPMRFGDDYKLGDPIHPPAGIDVGTVNLPVYVHPDGSDPIQIGTLDVPMRIGGVNQPCDGHLVANVFSDVSTLTLSTGDETPASVDAIRNLANLNTGSGAMASAQEPATRPITAPECAENAAATLRHAEEYVGDPKGAQALAEIAGGWQSLGLAIAQNYGLTRPSEAS